MIGGVGGEWEMRVIGGSVEEGREWFGRDGEGEVVLVEIEVGEGKWLEFVWGGDG